MRQPAPTNPLCDPSAYPLGSMQSRAAARQLLEARRKDLSVWPDERLMHSIARLAAKVIGGGTVLIRSDFLSFTELPEVFTPSDWGAIEAMALKRNLWGYGPGDKLSAVEVLADSIIPAQVMNATNEIRS